MNEKEINSSTQKVKSEVDALIRSTNEAVKKQYDTSMQKAIRYMRTNPLASQKEKNEFLAVLVQQYRANVEKQVSVLDKEYRNRVAQTFGHLFERGSMSVSAELSLEKREIIATVVGAFEKEAKLLIDTRGGALGAFSVKEEYSRFENMMGSGQMFDSSSDLAKWNMATYGVSSVKSNSQSILEALLTRCTVKEDYAFRVALLGDVPQVKGFRVEVAKTNKYGKARKSDICDVLAGDYPKGFRFRGWHYNCRCVLRPLVDEDFLTPAMVAMGCIGVKGDVKLAVSDAARSFLAKNAQEYKSVFPDIAECLYVDYHGQKRFLADMGVHERTGFYMEDLVRNSDVFPRVELNIAVSNKEFSNSRIFMETKQEPDVYRIAMGEKMEQNLISAFGKKGTGIALTSEQMHATSSSLHELIHNMVKDYTEQQTFNSKEVDVLTAINYLRGLGIEREIMEVFTEWKMRNIYKDVMSSYGLTVPNNYMRFISRGYNKEVSNFNAFLEKVNNPEQVKALVEENLLKPNKARVYMDFKKALVEKGIVKPNANIDLLMDVLVYEKDADEFNRVMDNLLVQKSPSDVVTATTAVAVVAKNDALRNEVNKSLVDLGFDAKVKKIGDVKVNSNGLTVENAVLKNMAKGAAVVGGAVILTEGVKNGLGVKGQEDKRYLPGCYYKDSYDDAVMCGFIDGAVSLVDAGKDMVASVSLYSMLAVGNALSKVPIFVEKVNGKLCEMSKSFASSQFGIATTVVEVADFVNMYTVDVDFREAVNDVIWRECKDYFSAMGGFSPENGYKQGRAVFDLINLLAGAGMLKGVMTTWRRTRKIDALTRVLRSSKKINAPKKALPASA